MATIVFPLALAAQPSLVDSILALPADSNKIIALSDLGYNYRSIDQDSAIMFGEQAIELGESLGHKKGIAQAYNDISIVYMDRSEYDQANEYLHRSLVLRQEIQDSSGQAAVYSKLAQISQEQFKLKEALAFNLKALPYYERNGPPVHFATMLNNIAIIHNNMREYDLAIETHIRALAIRTEIDHKVGIGTSHGNLANSYLYRKDTAVAIQHYNEAIDIFRKLDWPKALAVQLHNLAGVLLNTGKPEEAQSLFQEALQIRLAENDQKGTASTLVGLGKTYLQFHQFDKARNALLRSLNISRSINTLSESISAYETLYRLYAQMNKGDSALLYFDRFTALRDSVFNADLSSEVAQMRTKYETAQKERENLMLQVANSRQRYTLMALSAGLLLVIGIAAFLIYRRKAHEKRRISEARVQEKEEGLKAVLLGQETERRRIARDLHDSVGQSLSGAKMAWQNLLAELPMATTEQKQKAQATTQLLDAANAEVRSISHQMMPRALQETGLVPAMQDLLDSAFGNGSIQHSLEHHNADGRFPEEVEIGLYRVCQELINNIIKHSEATEVSVQLIHSKKNLVLIVEDNGKGFESHETKDGIGLLNIRSRMDTVHGNVNFEPSPESGTVATIRVPIV